MEFEDGRALAESDAILWYLSEGTPLLPTDPEWHAKGNAALKVMQTHLAVRDWFAGHHYSIADIALYGYTHCAADGGFDLAAYPAVGAWLKRVERQRDHVSLEVTW